MTYRINFWRLCQTLNHIRTNLFLSKLRSEIESNGSYAASNIINKKFLQAAWLKELLQKEDEYAIKTAAWQAVTKLWEELAYEIKQSLDDFTINLVRDLKKLTHL
ncbi:hypothetical protein [Escherichia coli]|uniref:hypothetical protein n=1 Tax=Escherichia coli TaxID=562 RepID=UPI003976A322